MSTSKITAAANAAGVLVACVGIAACVPLEAVAATTADGAQAVGDAINNNNGATTPGDAAGAVLDVAVWVLAALGLVPVARGVAMARPGLVGLVHWLVPTSKKVAPPKPQVPPPGQAT